jgi:hypothetical protein
MNDQCQDPGPVVWMRPVAPVAGVDKAGTGSRCGAGGGRCGAGERWSWRRRDGQRQQRAGGWWTRWAVAGAVGRGRVCPNLSE